MADDTLYQEKEILEQMLMRLDLVDFETILQQSQKVDKLIFEYYKKRGK